MSQQHNAAVYAIENKVTGKCYVGSTINSARRFACHRWELNKGRSRVRHLQHAWDKYGASSFEFLVLAEHLPPDSLIEQEAAWISLLDATNPSRGYNTGAVPDKPYLGKRHSESWLNAMSARLRGNTHTLGKKLSRETCERMSTAAKAWSNSDAGRVAKVKAAAVKWARTDRSQCKRGHEFTPENTYELNGRRFCHACHRIRQAAYRRKR